LRGDAETISSQFLDMVEDYVKSHYAPKASV